MRKSFNRILKCYTQLIKLLEILSKLEVELLYITPVSENSGYLLD